MRALLAAALVALCPLAAHANVKTLHAIPAVAAGFNGKTTLQLQAKFPGVEVRFLFGETERNFLRSAGKNAYANSVRIDGVSAERLEDFLEYWKLLFPQAVIELSADASLQSLRQDPLFPEQWALENSGQKIRVDIDDIRSKPVASVPGEDLQIPVELLGSPDRQIRVAVLDTGIDSGHPDLAPQIQRKEEECKLWQQFTECRANVENSAKDCFSRLEPPLDRDGNGYPMDCAGWSVVDELPELSATTGSIMGSPDTQDILGHGTHVAGVIGASSRNGIGIRGVAPHVRLIPVKVISATPSAPIRPQSFSGAQARTEDLPDPSEEDLKWPKSSVDLVARGMLYAIREKADIINLSLGWPAALESQVMRQMVKLAHERGIAVIAAAGNDATDALVQPCSFPEVICVGAHGPDGLRAHFSNAGPGVDLFAPGVSILSTWPLALRPSFYTDRNGYEFRNGTSMASPQVSGVFALLMGQGFTRDDVLGRLLRGGRAVSNGLGAVKVDVRRALQVVDTETTIRPVEKTPVRLLWDDQSDVVVGTVQLKNLRAPIADVRISARLSESSPLGTRDIQVDSSEVNFESWREGEIKSVPLRFVFSSTGVPRGFWLELQIRFGSQLQKTWVAFDVRPTMARVLRHLPGKRFRIEGTIKGRDPQPRSVVAMDGSSDRAFLVISKTKEGRFFQLLLPSSENTFQLSESQMPAKTEGDFLVAQRFRSLEDGNLRWAFIFKKKNEILGTTAFRIEIFNSEFNSRLSVIEYDGSVAPLPEKFRWVRYNERDAIAFIGDGFQPPPSEPDPWSVAEPFIDLRMYLLDHTGTIRQYVPPKPYRAVLFLPETNQDRLRGESPVLLVRGDDYAIEYAIGHFREGAIQSVTPFEFSAFRHLGRLSLSPVFTEEGGVAPAWAAAGPIQNGQLRVTRIFRASYDSMASDDVILSARGDLDGITRLAGSFQLQGGASYYTQTNWDLQFHQGDKILSTSLQRFSFLPWNLFQRGFFPVILAQGSAHLPAMLVMDLSIAGISMSVVYPEAGENGVADQLQRPALLQFENEPRCSWIGNPSWDDALRSTQLYSFCGNELRSIPLSLPTP